MKINEAGLNLIKYFESLSLTPYLCEASKWTIGYGHTRGVSAKSTEITEKQATELLKEDIEEAEDFVNKFLKVEITENMFSALVSLVFNAGPSTLEGTIGELINEEKFKEAGEFFNQWIYVTKFENGKKIKVKSNGLIKRRKLESKLFLADLEE